MCSISGLAAICYLLLLRPQHIHPDFKQLFWEVPLLDVVSDSHARPLNEVQHVGIAAGEAVVVLVNNEPFLAYVLFDLQHKAACERRHHLNATLNWPYVLHACSMLYHGITIPCIHREADSSKVVAQGNSC